MLKNFFKKTVAVIILLSMLFTNNGMLVYANSNNGNKEEVNAEEISEVKEVILDKFIDSLSINAKDITKIEFKKGIEGREIADGIRVLIDNSDVYINIEENVIAKLPKDSSKYFYGLTNLAEINGLELLDASNVENMASMFEGNKKLKKIDISSFNPNNLLKTTDMFRDNAELRYINIENLDTSNVIDMVGMFNICPKLTEIVGIENMDTSSAKKLDWMFYDDRELVELDLSNWTVSSEISMNQCFTRCSNLETVYISEMWDEGRRRVGNATDGTTNLTKIKFVDGEDKDNDIDKDTNNITIDIKPAVNNESVSKDENETTVASYDDEEPEEDMEKNSKPLSFSLNSGIKKEVVLEKFIDSLDISQYEIEKLEFRRGTGGKELTNGVSALVEGNNVYINIAEGVSAKFPEDASEYFAEMESVSEIRGLELLDASDVTNMSKMFNYCYELKSIDISSFRPNNLLNTNNMFYVCSELTYINMKNFDTSKVTDMKEMFAGCSKLAKIDGIQGMKTDSTNRLTQIFYGDHSLIELNLTNWTVTSSTNLRNCFSDCKNLEKVYVSNKWDSSRRKVGNSTDGTPNLTKLQFIEKEIEEEETEAVEPETSETKPVEPETTETKPAETETAEKETTEPETSETKPVEPETTETKPVETETAETETTEPETSETKPVEPKTTETKPAETEPETTEPETAKEEIDGKVVVLESKNIFNNLGIEKKNIEILEFRRGTGGKRIADGVYAEIEFISETDVGSLYVKKYAVYINIEEGVHVKLPSDATGYFSHLTYATKIKGLELLDTSDVTNMTRMFEYCHSLQSIDISSFKSENLTKAQGMFFWCEQLTYINMKNFDTSKVESFRDMFSCCERLTTIDGIEEMKNNSAVDTKNGMSGTFNGCFLLVELNLTNWTVTTNTDLNSCFNNCKKLEKVYVSNKWDSGRKRLNSFHDGTYGLTNLRFISVDIEEDETEIIPSTVVLNSFIDNLAISKYSIKKLEFKIGKDGDIVLADGIRGKVEGENAYINIREGVTAKLPNHSRDYFKGMSKVEEIKGLELLDATDVTNMRSMFFNCSSLKNIDISSFKPSLLLEASDMFKNCKELTYINMKNLNTSKVISMNGMFYGCSKLEKIDGIEEMKTDSTMHMNEIFYEAESIKELDLSNWTIKLKTTLDRCFYQCNKLEKIYISDKWDEDRRRINNKDDGTDGLTKLKFINKETGEVYEDNPNEKAFNKIIGKLSIKYNEIEKLEFRKGTDGKEIANGIYEKVNGKSVTINIKDGLTIKLPADSKECFKGMSKVVEIKGLELLDTTNVTNMSGMFDSCSSLKTIDVSSFNSSNLLNTTYMFKDCSELTYINMKNFDTSKVVDMNGMFKNCPKLTTIDGIEEMKTNSAKSLEQMFYGNEFLTELNLTNWTVKSGISLLNCFKGCKNLMTVYISDKWDESKRKNNDVLSGTEGIDQIIFVIEDGDMPYDPEVSENTIITSDILFNNLGIDKKNITKISFVKNKPTKGNVKNIAPNLFAYVNGTEVTYYVENRKISMPNDASNMFSGLSKIKEISGLNVIDCSNLQNMQGMFKGNSELTKIDFGNVDFSNVSNIEELFSGDSKLNTLSNLNIQTLKNAVKGNVFKGINNLNFIKNNRKLLSKDESIVELDLNGGKFSGNGTTFYIKGNEEYNLPKNVVRDGYILKGWECDLDKKNYRSIVSKYHKDVKFKAVWEQKISQKTIKYVSEIVAEWGYDKETVKGQLEKKGYSVIDFDLNDGSYKDGKQAPYIYVGVKTTTNRDDAITDIIADVKDSSSNKGSRTMERNVRGKGKCKYYGVKRLSDSSKLVDFNETAGGKWIYLFYTKDKTNETHSDQSPLTGIEIGRFKTSASGNWTANGVQFNANKNIQHDLYWSNTVIEEKDKYKVNMNYDSRDINKNKSGKEDKKGVYIIFENLYHLEKIIEKTNQELENNKFGNNAEEYWKIQKLGDPFGGYEESYAFQPGNIKITVSSDKPIASPIGDGKIEELNNKPIITFSKIEERFIKDIKMVVANKKTAEQTFKNKGYTMISKNLNSGTNGKEIYLGYTTTYYKSEAMTSLGEISFNRSHQNTPSYTGKYHKYTYEGVSDFNDTRWNTNEGKAGSFVYLYGTKSVSAGKGDVITEFEVLDFKKAQTISSLQENGKWIVVTNIDNNGLSNFNKDGGDYIYIRYKNSGLDEYYPAVYEEGEEVVNEEKPKKLLKENNLNGDKYIKDIKMVVANKKTAEETFKSKGYTIVSKNLNSETNGKEIYIGYTTTNDKSDAITSIGERWFNAAGRNPQNYTGSYHKNYYTAVTDFSGKQWNTNEGGNSAARWVYLYTSKDTKAGEPIKAIEVLSFTKAQTISALEQNNIWTVVTNSNDNGLSDFNRGADGDRIYIRYKK